MSSEKDESVPLRRSLRISSSSPTPSRVLSRNSSEGSPHPSKLKTKRRLSRELSPNRDKIPTTRRSARKISSIQEENFSDTEKESTVKDNLTEITSTQKKDVNVNLKNNTKRTRNARKISSIQEEDLADIEKESTFKEKLTETTSQKKVVDVNPKNNTKRTRNKSTTLEKVTEVKKQIVTTTRITRSQSNLISENPTETNSEEAKKDLVVLLTPITEVCDAVTNLDLTDNEPQNAVRNGNNENVQDVEQCNQKNQENSNEENSCLEEKIKQKTASVEDKSDVGLITIDDSSSVKSESDCFSMASDAVTSDNIQSDELTSLKINSSNGNDSEEIKKSPTTDEKILHEQVSETTAHCEIDNLQIETDEEQLKDSSVSLKNSEDNKESKLSNENSINSKIDDLLKMHSVSNSEDEDEEEKHEFIVGMAEEGEEDTPSEGSNDIVEIGEEINTTDSDFSSDGSYDKDSFIDDDEKHVQLLSGDEYDLSLNSPKKKSRIITLSSGSDDEIVRIVRTKKEKPKKKRKSRIMKFSDSSAEEAIDVEEPHENGVSNSLASEDKNVQNEVEKNESNEKENAKIKSPIAQEKHEMEETPVIEKDFVTANEENDKNIQNTQTTDKTDKTKPTLIKNNSMVDVFLESFRDEVQSEQEILNAPSSPENITKTDRDTSHKNEGSALNKKKKQSNESVDNVSDDVQSDTNVKRYSSTPNKNFVEAAFDESHEIGKSLETDKINNISFNASVSYINENNTDNENKRKKIVIIENIRVQDIKDKRLSDQINEVIDSWSSGMLQNATDVSINLSLNYIDKFGNADELKEKFDKKKLATDEEKMLEGKSLEDSTHKQRKKKRTRERKVSITLSSEENADDDTATTLRTEKKKKKKKHVSQDSDKKEVHCDLLQEDKDEIQTEETESHILKKKKKKRKRSKTEIFPSVDNEPEPEPSLIKKKKRKMAKAKQSREEIKSINIIDEAVQDNRKKKLVLLTPDVSDIDEWWKVKKRVIKPSVRPAQDVNEIENKIIKCSTSENTKRFHVKDFKNLMLFDSTRVRRVDTKQLLKKKM